MSEMIERVARRMAVLDRRDPDSHPESEYRNAIAIPDIAWPDDAKIWHSYAWKARDVIAAMREPTEGMIEAACDAHIDHASMCPTCVPQVWQPMIDAALK